MVTRRAHNPEHVGSSPTFATTSVAINIHSLNECQ